MARRRYTGLSSPRLTAGHAGQAVSTEVEGFCNVAAGQVTQTEQGGQDWMNTNRSHGDQGKGPRYGGLLTPRVTVRPVLPTAHAYPLPNVSQLWPF